MRSLAIAAALFIATPALAGNGLFLAWPGQSAEALHQWDQAAAPRLKDAGCRLHRSGRFTGTLGPLGWPEMAGFRLYSCARPVLTELAGSGTASLLTHHGLQPVLFEGSLILFPSGQPGPDAEYIVKLSHYSNTDPAQRNTDLAALGVAISDLERVWQTEGVLTPDMALGTLRPDDLTFLYYRTGAEAEAFRAANPGILEQVGRFNKEHLTSFTYLGAIPDALPPE